VAHIATTHIVCRGDCVIIEGQICRVANSSSAILNARVDHVEGGNTLQRAGFAQNASRTFPITINNTNFARQVNFKHPLAQGLTAWYLASPVTSQGLYWYDIVGKHHALFANLQQRFLGGYRPTSRKGGFGSILFFGGASQGAVGPPNELIGTGPFTVSFWIMGVSSGTVIYKTDNNASAGLYIQVNIPSLLVAVVFNGTDCTRSCAPPPFGSWTHVVVTWRGGSAASNIHVYYNGVEVSYSGATDGTGTHGSDSGQPLVIGSYNQITSFVTGYLDDVRIYNRALPANTVLASYTNSLASYPNLINRTSKPINFSFVYGPAAAPLLCVASIGAMPMVNHIATCAIRANSFIGANGFVITPFFGSGGLNFGGSAHSYPVMNFYPSGGIFFNTFPSFANAITSRNPLVWYRLDDPSGTTAVNSGSLGSAMNGTYHGDFTLNQTSLILSDPSNASVLFGGTSSYLLSPDNVAINSSTPYTQRTIELWFRTGADVVTRRTLYEEGDITRGFGIYLDSYVIVMIVWNMTADSGSPAWGFHYVFSSPILQSHQRYHAALSFHAAGHVIAGYLNGVLFGIHGGLADNVGSHDAISIGAKNNGTRYIDGPSTGSGNRFNNLIDEVIVYSDYSDPDEIAFDYHASFPSGYYIPNFVVDGSGGLMLGGTGIVNHILTWINTSGGLIFSGSSDASFQLSYIGTGGLIFSGSADADVETRIYFGTGGLIFGGQADCIVLSHSYTGTGGLIFGGGSTGGQVTYVISLPISWNVNANLSTTLVLSWSIGQGSMMFYTVETNCSTQTCPPLSDSTASCLSRQVMTIPARSLEEVCSKLKKAGIITNIASVKMYSNPVFLSDFTKTQSVNCNTLTDVTAQFFAVSDCS
jgi:hypothetical protein